MTMHLAKPGSEGDPWKEPSHIHQKWCTHQMKVILQELHHRDLKRPLERRELGKIKFQLGLH